MKTRAAVAFEAKRPLEIVELELDGPRAGEVLVEIMATGICHTDAYTLDGLDSEGLFPSVLGHEGAGIVREVGAGRDQRCGRRPRHPAVHALSAASVSRACQRQDQPVHRHPRDAGASGVMPDGTTPVQPSTVRPVFHYMGCSTFSNFTVLPEIAVAKIRPDAPFKTSCYIGCGVTTGVGAVVNTAKVEAGANVVVFGLGRHRPQRHPGGAAGRCRTGSSASTSIRRPRGVGPPVRHDRLRQPERRRRRPRRAPRRADSVAARITPSIAPATPTVMRQALECVPSRLGRVGRHRRRRIGQGNFSTRPFQLVTGRVWKR